MVQGKDVSPEMDSAQGECGPRAKTFPMENMGWEEDVSLGKRQGQGKDMALR
jgi:hypothetical protein